MSSKTKTIALAAGLVALALAGQAQAQQSPWLIRARVVNINPADKSDAIPGVAPADAVSVSTKTIPEIDVSYFFTPNIAAELVLTYPQKHNVSLSGTNIGSFKHLPPTLTLQYHFKPEAQVSPYVGAGLNYTRISGVRLLNGAGDLQNDSFGLALQGGVDVRLTKNWSVNLDVKKVQIRSDLSVNGAKVGQVKVDPWLFGVGLGYRF